MMEEPEQRPHQQQQGDMSTSILKNVPNAEAVPLNSHDGRGRGGLGHGGGNNSHNVSFSDFGVDSKIDDGEEDDYDDDSTEHTPKSQKSQDEDDYGDDGSVRSGNSFRRKKKKKSSNSHAFAERETNAVKCLKVTFILLLTILAGVLSGFIYMRIHRTEVEEFETDFIDRSYMIYNSLFISKLRSKLNTIQSLSISLTISTMSSTSASDSAGGRSGNNWPFVTIPDFDIRAMTASSSSMASAAGSATAVDVADEMILAPLVETNDRHSWESYVQSQTGSWLPQSIERSSRPKLRFCD